MTETRYAVVAALCGALIWGLFGSLSVRMFMTFSVLKPIVAMWMRMGANPSQRRMCFNLMRVSLFTSWFVWLPFVVASKLGNFRR
jgi:cytochrome b